MNYNLQNSYQDGFTLAEILVTLVVIGVVSAMTIPAAMNNAHKKDLIAQLKKANSTLTQAIYKMGLNNGYPVGDYYYFDDVDFIDEFAKVVKTEKKCSNSEECFGESISGGGKYFLLNGSSASFDDGKSVATTDGQLFSYCNTGSDSWGLSNKDAYNVVGRILVDVNGQALPNTTGLDVFIFYLVDGKGIVPAGSFSTSDCNRSNSGYTCAAKVLNDNDIKYYTH